MRRTIAILLAVAGSSGCLQMQDQIIDWQVHRVCWPKYGRSTAFECWRWDGRRIYHEVDHGLDGDRTGASYRFTDGRFLPRRLVSGRTWMLDLSGQ